MEEIFRLFAKLKKAEQIELIKLLKKNTKTSISIADFAIKCQKTYAKDIFFKVHKTGPDHAPTITVIVETPYGDFEGKGSNQKIAIANACEDANANWPTN